MSKIFVHTWNGNCLMSSLDSGGVGRVVGFSSLVQVYGPVACKLKLPPSTSGHLWCMS